MERFLKESRYSSIEEENSRYYEVDKFSYTEERFTSEGEFWGGEEIRRKEDDKIVFTSSFRGRCKCDEPKGVYDFLKKALSVGGIGTTTRGPKNFQEGDWKYSTELVFQGVYEERISYEDKIVYFCTYECKKG